MHHRTPISKGEPSMRIGLLVVASVCACLGASTAWSKPTAIGDTGGIKGVILSGDTGGIKGKPVHMYRRGNRNPTDQG
jgi:hypothetical protein